MFLIILFSLLFCRGFQSYGLHNEAALKNEIMIDKILRSYVKPIKQLTENFPNHELELQIQFQASTKRTPRRRYIVYKKPKINYRRDMGTDKVPFDLGPGYLSTKKVTTVTGDKSTKKVTATPVYTSTREVPTVIVPQTTVTSPTTISSTKTTENRLVTSTTEDPDKKLVYLKDLQRIFNEFADQIKSSKCPRDHATTNQYPPQLVISNPGPIHSNQNINDVIELIRKGKLVKKHVPMPTDEDLDWLQIKIPT